MRLGRRAWLVLCVVALIALVLVLRRDPMPPTQPSEPESRTDRTVSIEERADAIARASVWRAPTVAVARATLGPEIASHIDCRFALSDLGGTTPKFHCLLDGGDEIRAKYGIGSEIPAEAAATRLLSALGFGADNVMLVERLRCHGCPKEPFVTSKVVEKTGTQDLYEQVVDRDGYEEFEWAAVESRIRCDVDRGRREERLGLLRARHGRPLEGRCAASTRRRGAAHRRLPRALG